MIKRVDKNITFRLKDSKKDIKLEEEINKNWEVFIKGKEGFFNGDIFVVDGIPSDEINYNIISSKYARIVYAKTHSNVKAYSLFASILFKTKDNYYVFIKNNHDRINVIGGLASKEDFDEDIFNPSKCLGREIKEEIGLDLNNKEHILSFSMNYLTLPDTSINVGPFGIVFTGVLNYTKDELLSYFSSNRERLDNEIKELLFFTNETYLELNKYLSKEPYLMDLMNEVV